MNYYYLLWLLFLTSCICRLSSDSGHITVALLTRTSFNWYRFKDLLIYQEQNVWHIAAAAHIEEKLMWYQGAEPFEWCSMTVDAQTLPGLPSHRPVRDCLVTRWIAHPGLIYSSTWLVQTGLKYTFYWFNVTSNLCMYETSSVITQYHDVNIVEKQYEIYTYINIASTLSVWIIRVNSVHDDFFMMVRHRFLRIQSRSTTWEKPPAWWLDGRSADYRLWSLIYY